MPTTSSITYMRPTTLAAIPVGAIGRQRQTDGLNRNAGLRRPAGTVAAPTKAGPTAAQPGLARACQDEQGKRHDRQAAELDHRAAIRCRGTRRQPSAERCMSER